MEQYDIDISKFEGMNIEANYNSEMNEVEIIFNPPGLRYLTFVIQQLLEEKTISWHIDTITGLSLEGNIPSLVISTFE